MSSGHFGFKAGNSSMCMYLASTVEQDKGKGVGLGVVEVNDNM